MWFKGAGIKFIEISMTVRGGWDVLCFSQRGMAYVQGAITFYSQRVQNATSNTDNGMEKKLSMDGELQNPGAFRVA